MNGENAIGLFFDDHTQLAEDTQCAEAILTAKVVAQMAYSIGERGEQGGAMGDALVSGNPDIRLDARRAMYTDFHGYGTDNIAARFAAARTSRSRRDAISFFSMTSMTPSSEPAKVRRAPITSAAPI